jgi:hypothetical protein
VDILGDWAAENEIKINPNKCKIVRFTKARVKDRSNYTLGDLLIPEASISKYFRNNLAQRLKLS